MGFVQVVNSFDPSPFSAVLFTQVSRTLILFCETANNTMQRDDFATKFSYRRKIDWKPKH